jgi:DMSO/TMAO reductase YedYZ heme-binding membrane subunit
MPILAATTPSAFWYMTRGTGTVAVVLLSLTVAIGIATMRRAEIPGVPRFVLGTIHRNLSLLAVVFVVLHVATTLLDGFAPISLLDAVIPFKSAYRPIWLGLGTVAFDLLLAVTITSLLRLRLGYDRWKAIHWLAYVSWPVALVHGLGTGTDASTHWMLVVTAACVAVVLTAVALRISAGWPNHLATRLSAVGIAALFAVGLAAWLPGGPLGTDWAKRAGTPSYLLPKHTVLASTSVASGSASSGSASSAPGSFTAPVSGRVRQAQLFTGNLLVDISLGVQGQKDSRLSVRIQGQPINGGGVEMTSSRVTLGPSSNPDQYSGHVTALAGTNIEASVSDAAGAGFDLIARLEIPPGADASASGTLTATARGGTR